MGRAYTITSSCYNPVYGQAEDYPVIIYSNAVLPVTYTSFHIQADGIDAVLDWKTATESLNAQFIVERSTDGVRFQAAGVVKGKNAAQGAAYQFRDKKPGEGVIYYRLKQQDMDGSFAYSAIRSVSITVSANRNIRLLSNLVDQEIKLQVNFQSGSHKTYVRLMDMSGRMLLSREFKAERSAVYTIDLSGLPLSGGMYLVEITNGADRWIEKVIKK